MALSIRRMDLDSPDENDTKAALFVIFSGPSHSGIQRSGIYAFRKIHLQRNQRINPVSYHRLGVEMLRIDLKRISRKDSNGPLRDKVSVNLATSRRHDARNEEWRRETQGFGNACFHVGYLGNLVVGERNGRVGEYFVELCLELGVAMRVGEEEVEYQGHGHVGVVRAYKGTSETRISREKDDLPPWIAMRDSTSRSDIGIFSPVVRSPSIYNAQ